MRRRLRALAIASAIAALTLSTAATASATPVDDGCPASATLTSVEWLEEQGDYRVPAYLDDVANGGNGDGDVCAFPLPQAVSDAWTGGELLIYQFLENNRATKAQA